MSESCKRRILLRGLIKAALLVSIAALAMATFGSECRQVGNWLAASMNRELMR